MECLVGLLKSEDEAVKTLSASLVASLAHTRAGIPNGLITAGLSHFVNLFDRLKALFGSPQPFPQGNFFTVNPKSALWYLRFPSNPKKEIQRR